MDIEMTWKARMNQVLLQLCLLVISGLKIQELFWICSGIHVAEGKIRGESWPVPKKQNKTTEIYNNIININACIYLT